jgi:hypothetical protein
MIVGRKLFRGSWAAFAAGTAVFLSVSGASADIWCRRDFDRDNAVCMFKDARDCLSAAVIVGGVCEREKLGNGAAKSCDSTRARSAKARRSGRPIACEAG